MAISTTDLDDLPIRAGLGQFREVTTEQLRFIKQCGVDDFLLNAARLPGRERWDYEDLAWLVQQASDTGLRLAALENVPSAFYDQIMLGGPKREQQLENMAQTIRNMARAGIRILGYHFNPAGVWRASRSTPVRGGALATSFNLDLARSAPQRAFKSFHAIKGVDREYTEEEMWANYEWYLERILPVCEEVSVRMALHPADPPIAHPLSGVPHIFNSFESFERSMATFDSPMHGLEFCHGCWSEMRGGAGVLEAIHFFGKRIVYVHFRDVTGTADDFTECFLGNGNCDPVASIRALKEVGFRGFVMPDHVPHMVNDTEWGHRGRALAVGYIQGLLAAVTA